MNALASVRRKMEHFDGRTHAAYLTPVEIVAVADAGWKVPESNVYAVDVARNDVAAGRSKPRWFYFEPAP